MVIISVSEAYRYAKSTTSCSEEIAVQLVLNVIL